MRGERAEATSIIQHERERGGGIGGKGEVPVVFFTFFFLILDPEWAPQIMLGRRGPT